MNSDRERIEWNSVRKPTEFDALIGKRIRLRRSIIGMTQETLAEKLGVSFQQLQKYESGRNRTTVSRLAEIATILETDATWFLRASPEIEKSQADVALSDRPKLIAHTKMSAPAPTRPTSGQLSELIEIFYEILDAENRASVIQFATDVRNAQVAKASRRR